MKEETTEERDMRLHKHKKVLDSVLEILEDTEKINKIMNKYDKENESIAEYRNNRKERIMEVLKLVNVNPEDYLTALKESSRKGITVILARDIDELNVNNYDPEWLEAWNGNIDKQPCLISLVLSPMSQNTS